MACVTACPSGVRYDLLVNHARADIETRHRRGPVERLKRRAIFTLFPHHRRLAKLTPLLPLAHRVNPLAPPKPPSTEPLPEVTPAVGERRAVVGFLQGCVQRAWFPHVNRATVEVLAAEGYEVHAPAEPECCGSLELHAGEADSARRRAKETQAAFADFDLIVTNAAGCGSGMREDPALAPKVRDASELLGEHGPRAPRRELRLRVAYHDACHLAHAQGIRSQPRELLRSIPGLELLEPDGWDQCCGSAGIYNITHPEPAAELGRRKAELLLATGAEAIAAANPGCTLQIQAHLRKLGRPLPVYHPMELLREAIDVPEADRPR
jgi:glycolate dehydrogenase iron-sulfur subunit